MKQIITANKTPRPITVIGYCLLVIVLSSCSGDGSQMRAQLEELERQNRADSVMTNDSLACVPTISSGGRMRIWVRHHVPSMPISMLPVRRILLRMIVIIQY